MVLNSKTWGHSTLVTERRCSLSGGSLRVNGEERRGMQLRLQEGGGGGGEGEGEGRGEEAPPLLQYLRGPIEGAPGPTPGLTETSVGVLHSTSIFNASSSQHLFTRFVYFIHMYTRTQSIHPMYSYLFSGCLLFLRTVQQLTPQWTPSMVLTVDSVQYCI